MVPQRDNGVSQKWALVEGNNVLSSGDCVSKKGAPSRAVALDSHRHTNPSYLLFWCVCVYPTGRRCHSTMCGQACSIQTTSWAAPWQRAAKPFSSPAFPQRSWEVSTLTERVGESGTPPAGGREGGISTVKYTWWSVKYWQLMFRFKNNVAAPLRFSRGESFPLSAFVGPSVKFHWFPIIVLRK